MITTDFVIVGAGAHGSAVAWQLSRRGAEVIVLERFEPGHALGSSHGTSRIFRITHAQPDEIQMALSALEGWRELETDSGTQLLRTTGGIDHGDQQAISELAGALTSQGVAHEILSAAEATTRWPGMRFTDRVLYQPDAGRIHAALARAVLQSEAEKRGAVFRFQEAVIGLKPGDERCVVVTDTESYQCRAAVICAGAWVTHVVGGLVELPAITVTAEQPAFFPIPDDTLTWPVWVHRFAGDGADSTDSGIYGGVYGLETPGEGMKVGTRATGPKVDPDDADRGTDPDRLALLAAYARKWLPGVEPLATPSPTCFYTMTPRERFIIERHGSLVVCSACSGHGFKHTPQIGAVVASLALQSDHELIRRSVPRVSESMVDRTRTT